MTWIFLFVFFADLYTEDEQYTAPHPPSSSILLLLLITLSPPSQSH